MKQEIKERVERIRKGEVPEGYKKTKVGIIPDDWDVLEVKKMFDPIRNGFVGIATPHYTENGIKYLQGKNIKRGTIVDRNIIQVTKEFHKINVKSQLKERDIVIVQSGHVGECAVISKKYDGTNCHALIIITPKEKINSEYYSYFFNSGFGDKLFYKIKTGNTIQHILSSDIKKMKVPFTKFKEQEKIAKILSTWDTAIELKEKLIEEKKKLRIAIVTNLLFGLKRFDDFIKSHKYNPTKYTNIPEDWEFIKIGEIATEVSEKNGNHDDLPVLSCTKYAGLVDSLTYFKKRVFSEDTSTYKQVKKNQFVYATNHIDEGSIGYQNLYENSLVSPMYTVFKTNSKVNNDFLFSLLKTRLYIFIYQVNMSASVDRRGSLRWNEFSKIRIPLPNIAEQNKIVEFIRLVDNEIDLLNKELNQLKEQKRGLVQLLLTGIVRVEVD